MKLKFKTQAYQTAAVQAVVFRDVGFKSDDVKINLEQIFKLLSPSTKAKSI